MTEQSNIPDPVETARSIFAAQQTRRWLDVAAFIHPDTAAHTRRAAILFAQEEEQQRADERLSAGDEEPIQDRPCWYREWYAVSSVEELEKLPAREVVARVAAHESPTITREVLGHVMESADTAHVVYRCTRERDDGEKTAAVELLTLKLSGDRWLAIGTGHLPAFWQSYSQ